MSHSPEPRPPTNSRILAALPPDEYERFAPHLKRVELRHGEVLCPAGEIIEYAYFPEDSLISRLSRTPDGASVEVGVIGFEGMAGLSLVLGVERSPHESIVQVRDGVTRMRADALVAEFRRGGALQDLLLRYTHAFILQVSQVAACNRLHGVGERLARWLLMCHDRCVCDDLPLLAVRRSTPKSWF